MADETQESIKLLLYPELLKTKEGNRYKFQMVQQDCNFKDYPVIKDYKTISDFSDPCLKLCSEVYYELTFIVLLYIPAVCKQLS